MQVDITTQDSKATIKVEGRVDTVTAKAFETEVMAVFNSNPTEIIMDCEALNYVSSSGLRVFLILKKTVDSKGCSLLITNMNDEVKQIFKITGFATILNIA